MLPQSILPCSRLRWPSPNPRRQSAFLLLRLLWVACLLIFCFFLKKVKPNSAHSVQSIHSLRVFFHKCPLLHKWSKGYPGRLRVWPLMSAFSGWFCRPTVYEQVFEAVTSSRVCHWRCTVWLAGDSPWLCFFSCILLYGVWCLVFRVVIRGCRLCLCR